MHCLQTPKQQFFVTSVNKQLYHSCFLCPHYLWRSNATDVLRSKIAYLSLNDNRIGRGVVTTKGILWPCEAYGLATHWHLTTLNCFSPNSPLPHHSAHLDFLSTGTRDTARMHSVQRLNSGGSSMFLWYFHLVFRSLNCNEDIPDDRTSLHGCSLTPSIVRFLNRALNYMLLKFNLE